jgi:alpha-ketoglutaric semialdehyde dehydrogenase
MKPALLLVDLQNDYLAATGLQPTADILISRATALLHGCRKRHIPVVHIWTTIHRKDDRRLPHWKEKNRWQCVAGTAGHQTPARLQPPENETVINKSGFNGFAGGGLDAALKKIDCDAVILAGIHLHTCVRTAAAEGLERGLQIFIADDAVASNDPVHAAAARRWLAGRGVGFFSADEILSRLDGKAPSKLIHHSPRETRKILFEIPIVGADEIATATRLAQNAGKVWRRTSSSSRREILEAAAARLESATPELARQMAIEIGKPVAHGREEVCRAAGNICDVIRRAKNFEFEEHEAAGMVRHQPPGVVALISPWNNPVAIPVGKIAPALIYGNTVVWKPAPAATKISEIVLKLLREAGVPDNAVEILTGDHTTAQKLAADEAIDAVTMTGSAQAGHAIQEICARRFLPLQAELSGNNAAIVWDNADWPEAAAEIARGAFGFAGQRCTANRRVIVPGKRFDFFWRELKAAAEKLVWGDPLEKSTVIGPVIHAGKREEQTTLISAAQNSGAIHRLEFLFEKRAGKNRMKAGAYAQPVMAGCDEPNHALVQEETMSPLLVVQRAGSFEQALKLCNGVRHGLVAALFSDSPGLQKKFMAGAKAGILKINSATAGVDASLPFGGWKMSGLGPPEHGAGDRLFYTRMQAVYGAEKQRPG